MSEPAGSQSQLVMEHVERPPLPWRSIERTECGLPVAGHPVISRDDFVAKVKAQGKQRAAFTTCMTCWETALRWPTWEQDPVQRLSRETYGGRIDVHFRAELTAIAALVAAHRDEFDDMLSGLAETVSLADRRTAHRRRTADHPRGRGA